MHDQVDTAFELLGFVQAPTENLGDSRNLHRTSVETDQTSTVALRETKFWPLKGKVR